MRTALAAWSSFDAASPSDTREANPREKFAVVSIGQTDRARERRAHMRGMNYPFSAAHSLVSDCPTPFPPRPNLPRAVADCQARPSVKLPVVHCTCRHTGSRPRVSAVDDRADRPEREAPASCRDDRRMRLASSGMDTSIPLPRDGRRSLASGTVADPVGSGRVASSLCDSAIQVPQLSS